MSMSILYVGSALVAAFLAGYMLHCLVISDRCKRLAARFVAESERVNTPLNERIRSSKFLVTVNRVMSGEIQPEAFCLKPINKNE